jgi:2,4-dienoyl-CoA reductase-like NADH-dependent reductase (Old Yellow Enzyme family)
MKEKLTPLFESFDINEDAKEQLTEAFEAAVLEAVTEKMDEYVEAKLTEETVRLEEKYREKQEFLTEALDGYMETVVEEFIEENAPVYEAEIEQEKVKTLLEMFDNMVKVVGTDMITIAEEAKDNDKTARLEEEVAKLSAKLIESKREADMYLKAGLVQELQEGLTVLEKEKFAKLAEMVEFSRDPSYVEKLEIIKESIIDARDEDFKMDENVRLPGEAFKPAEVDSKKVLDFSQYI